MDDRTLLNRRTVISVADRTATVLAFIDYFNRPLTKPLRWPYQDKALAA